MASIEAGNLDHNKAVGDGNTSRTVTPQPPQHTEEDLQDQGVISFTLQKYS